jgi:helicase MOV-10
LTSARPGHVNLTFKSTFIGRYEDRLELTFEDTQTKTRFMISRPFKVVVGNKEVHEALRPKTPYTPRLKTARAKVTKVVDGVPPAPRKKRIPYVGHLPEASIPDTLLAILDGPESIRNQVEQIRSAHLPSEFSSSTYAKTFKTLLWVEEHKAKYVSGNPFQVAITDTATEPTWKDTT